MRIGVLGAGRMAAALVSGWVSAGHDVLVAGRAPSRAAAMAEQTGARSGSLADADPLSAFQFMTGAVAR